MEKADRTPLMKWEKVLLYLQILAILLLCVSVFFMLIDINQKEKQFLPNHIKCILGKVDDLYVYVGVPGTAEEGIKRNALLRKEYPDHPCFQDVSNGTTAMQRMIMDQ